MSQHMVIFQNPAGDPGYNQFESIEEAVSFVETIRNEQGIDSIRIFELDEVKFDLKPYYKVELLALKAGAPAAAPAPAPRRAPAPAPAARPGRCSRSGARPRPRAGAGEPLRHPGTAARPAVGVRPSLGRSRAAHAPGRPAGRRGPADPARPVRSVTDPGR